MYNIKTYEIIFPMTPAQDTVVNVTPSTQYLNSSFKNTLLCEVHLSIVQVYLNPESSFSVDPILILTDLINDDLSSFLKRFSRYVSLPKSK